MKYFLCGFSGAGKSYYLKKLESSMILKNYQYFDLDLYIDQNYAHDYNSLGDYIRKVGFERFREIEAEVIVKLSKQDNIIVALGGGALNDKTLKILEGWNGFWISTSFETCYQRIENDENRPLSSMAKKDLAKLFEDREKIYQKFQKVQSFEKLVSLLSNP